MDWQDDGIILTVRSHGERSAILSVLTAEHGRHAGLVRGAHSRNLRGILQPGNQVRATWRARLDEHLGTFTVEGSGARVAQVMASPARLAAFISVTSLLDMSLSEREAFPTVYTATNAVLDVIAAGENGWIGAYVGWELGLLSALGFGLDLTTCAGGGGETDLIYVSPRTGRAVSGPAGQLYKDKLLTLPGFLVPGRGRPPANHAADDLQDAFNLTGYFLGRHVFIKQGQGLPEARRRFTELALRDPGLSDDLTEP